jgi:hypothetical protein
MDWDDLPHLRAWRDRIEARPALARVNTTMQRFVADDMKYAAEATQESFNRFFWREEDDGPKVDLTPMIAGHIKVR